MVARQEEEESRVKQESVTASILEEELGEEEDMEDTEDRSQT